MGAEHAERAEGVDRAARVARARRRDHLASGGERAGADGRERLLGRRIADVDRDPRDVLVAGFERGDHAVAVAGADGVRERVDPGAVAVDVLEHDDALSPGPHDVPEHRAGLDRGQLARVADQHEPRLGPHGLDQPRHQRERDHRGLVDDHDVVRQPVAAVVPEAAVAVGPPAEQAVQRRGVEREQALADAGRDVEPCRLGVHRLLEPRGRLAGRRGERDERRGRTGRRGLLGEQRDDPRHGRRLAGAGAAGDDREPAPHGGRRRRALALVRARRAAGRVAAPAAGPLRPRRRSPNRRARPSRRARLRRRTRRRRTPAGRLRPGAPRASSGRGRARCR